MYKEIIKGKNMWFCDVCGKEIEFDRESYHITIKKFLLDKKYELCNKCGKIIVKKINDMKNGKEKC